MEKGAPRSRSVILGPFLRQKTVFLVTFRPLQNRPFVFEILPYLAATMFSMVCHPVGTKGNLEGHDDIKSRKGLEFMRKIVGLVALMLMLLSVALGTPKAQRSLADRPFPTVLRNARYVYVASYDGDQFNPNLLPEDRLAISAVQDSIQKWGKLTLVYRPSEADIILLVQSRPSEDLLAVYDARTPSAQYLWRAMGRDGLQVGETPLATEFEKGFEAVHVKPGK